MDDFLTHLDTQQTQESLYHQWIDECSTCSLPRFQDILQALPSEWKLSAVHTAVRHFNRPALKWYLNQSPRGIPDILLYCCQLNYVELIMYLGQSIFKYQLQDLLTEDEKYSCIWYVNIITPIDNISDIATIKILFLFSNCLLIIFKIKPMVPKK